MPKMSDKKKSKYLAKKMIFHGETFDSKKEMERYIELLAMEQRGEIKNLERQAEYELIPRQKTPSGKTEPACFYRADFTYSLPDGRIVVEDVKGYKHSQAYHVFSIKRKLMLLLYKIEVIEV